VNSFETCRIAVKKVSSNPGKYTPGVDNQVWNDPKQRMDRTMALYNQVWSEYKALPVRRVWIPKPNGKKRPLGIPTMFDRTAQTV
jgi:RNA-directed DNA polymerase